MATIMMWKFAIILSTFSSCVLADNFLSIQERQLVKENIALLAKDVPKHAMNIFIEMFTVRPTFKAFFQKVDQNIPIEKLREDPVFEEQSSKFLITFATSVSASMYDSLVLYNLFKEMAEHNMPLKIDHIDILALKDILIKYLQQLLSNAMNPDDLRLLLGAWGRIFNKAYDAFHEVNIKSRNAIAQFNSSLESTRPEKNSSGLVDKLRDDPFLQQLSTKVVHTLSTLISEMLNLAVKETKYAHKDEQRLPINFNNNNMGDLDSESKLFELSNDIKKLGKMFEDKLKTIEAKIDEVKGEENTIMLVMGDDKNLTDNTINQQKDPMEIGHFYNNDTSKEDSEELNLNVHNKEACYPEIYSLKTQMINGKRYYFSKEHPLLSWYGADAYCKKHMMQLVSFESQEEWNALKHEVDLLSELHARYPWSSGSDATQEGYWKWSATGTDVTFFGGYYEMNNKNDKNCLYLTTEGWGDESCSSTRSFVCEQNSMC